MISIQNAKIYLQQVKNGHLPLSYRFAIMQEINNPVTTNKIFFECAKKVFPFWEKLYPEDKNVYDVLIKIHQYLYKQNHEIDFKKIFNNLFNTLQNWEDTPVLAAAYTTQQVAFSISVDAAFFYENAGEYDGENDDDYDYEMWQPDFYAAIIFANGSPFAENESDIEKRREFWNWFLEICEWCLINDIPKIDLPEISKENFNTTKERMQSYEAENCINIVKSIQNQLVNIVATAFDKIELQIGAVGNAMYLGAWYFIDKTKHTIPYSDTEVLYQTCIEPLKQKMYIQSPKEGAWLYVTMSLSSQKIDSINFEYDDKTLIDAILYDDDLWIAEMEQYPRSKAYTPQWLQKIIKKKKLSYL